MGAGLGRYVEGAERGAGTAVQHNTSWVRGVGRGRSSCLAGVAAGKRPTQEYPSQLYGIMIQRSRVDSRDRFGFWNVWVMGTILCMWELQGRGARGPTCGGSLGRGKCTIG